MEVSQQLCSEDSSKLTHVVTHLQALPLGHAAFMVGALYVGIVGLPPQQGGRVCAGSQKHLTRDCQSRPCVQQDSALNVRIQLDSGVTPAARPPANLSNRPFPTFSNTPHWLILFLEGNLVPSNDSIYTENQYLPNLSSSFNCSFSWWMKPQRQMASPRPLRFYRAFWIQQLPSFTVNSYPRKSN